MSHPRYEEALGTSRSKGLYIIVLSAAVLAVAAVVAASSRSEIGVSSPGNCHPAPVVSSVDAGERLSAITDEELVALAESRSRNETERPAVAVRPIDESGKEPPCSPVGRSSLVIGRSEGPAVTTPERGVSPSGPTAPSTTR